jgi:hypothetical protein
LYAAGKNDKGASFSNWQGLPELTINRDRLFSATDFMGNFFEYDYFDPHLIIHRPAVYVSNYKAAQHEEVLAAIKTKRAWASGTKTWFELAKQGVWVEGSADSLGLEHLQTVLDQPVLNLGKKDVHILTHNQGARHWSSKTWRATATYDVEKKENPEFEKKLGDAEAIFWSSIHQYRYYRDKLPAGVVHLSPSGETASLLKEAGVDPVIFPTIKAFEQWRKSFSLSHSAG